MNARELLDAHELTISESGAAYCGEFIRRENSENWCEWFWGFDTTSDDHDDIREDHKEHMIQVLEEWKKETRDAVMEGIPDPNSVTGWKPGHSPRSLGNEH